MTDFAAPSPDDDDRDAVAPDSERDVQTLISDALDTPPVPVQLGRRIDVALGQRWGERPGLVPARPQPVRRIIERRGPAEGFDIDAFGQQERSPRCGHQCGMIRAGEQLIDERFVAI